ncbi:hypothetical protein Dimus_039109 [Dionaea muscipula]
MVDNRDCKNGIPLSYEDHVGEELVFSDEDVADELAYWKEAVIGYVLGDTIPFSAMDSFVTKHWSMVSRPRIILHEGGYFIFRFESGEDKLRVLGSSWFFKSKPLVLREWSPEFSMAEVSLNRIPTWVQFRGLGLQFWGAGSLDRIAARVGKPMRTDLMTANKDRVSYPRVLVDVDTTREVVEEVQFIGPGGQRFVQKVFFEWFPHKCSKCDGWGHKEDWCKCAIPRR